MCATLDRLIHTSFKSRLLLLIGLLAEGWRRLKLIVAQVRWLAWVAVGRLKAHLAEIIGRQRIVEVGRDLLLWFLTVALEIQFFSNFLTFELPGTFKRRHQIGFLNLLNWSKSVRAGDDDRTIWSLLELLRSALLSLETSLEEGLSERLCIPSAQAERGAAQKVRRALHVGPHARVFDPLISLEKHDCRNFPILLKWL